MDEQRLDYLFQGYLVGTLTEAEQAEWTGALQDAALREQLNRLIDHSYYELSDAELQSLSAERAEAIVEAIIQHHPVKVRPIRRWLAVAASLLLLASAAVYLLRDQPAPAMRQSEAMVPATNGITLAVAGQKAIVIDYHHKGQLIAGQIHQTDSLLAYSQSSSAALNTLTNNSGHQMRLQLADGTAVILDVASSLSFPSAFTGEDRRVTLIGQGYFKVKHDSRHPFYVSYQGQTTKDIGTEFNISAYPGEAAATTLISGRIQVGSKMLRPGERILNDQISAANIEEVTAWLQDKMIFHHETLENIMRAVARIYKVEVIYRDDQVRSLTFGGAVSRNKKLSTILNFIRETGQVGFRVEGNTVTVFKQP